MKVFIIKSHPHSISLPIPSIHQPISFPEATSGTSFLFIFLEILYAYRSISIYIYICIHICTSFSNVSGKSRCWSHTGRQGYLLQIFSELENAHKLCEQVACHISPPHQHFLWQSQEEKWPYSVSIRNISSASLRCIPQQKAEQASGSPAEEWTMRKKDDSQV